MPGETEEAEVPAYTDGSGAILGPELVGDVGDVLQLEPRSLRVGCQADLDPGDLAGVLPGQGEVLRRIAGGDRAPGIALELVAPAQLELATDGEEPARDPLGAGQGVLQVVGRGGVHPAATTTRAGFPSLSPDRTVRVIAFTALVGSMRTQSPESWRAENHISNA
jgi:hypothetical protein